MKARTNFKWICVMTIIISMIFLAACSSSKQNSSTNSNSTKGDKQTENENVKPDNVTLKWLTTSRGEPRRQGHLTAIREFEKLHPHVKVEFEELPYVQYLSKISIAVSSGSGIDVFDVDSPLISNYVHNDVLRTSLWT